MCLIQLTEFRIVDVATILRQLGQAHPLKVWFRTPSEDSNSMHSFRQRAKSHTVTAFTALYGAVL